MAERGFVTIATGNEKYYKMAQTLLRSYRGTTEAPMRFALICDRENEYTKEFDDLVLLKDPANSYMDKVRLLQVAPYEESLFIDADCIAFGDLNHFWSYFENATDVSCFGEVHPTDSTEGYFRLDGIGVYAHRVDFIPSFHGVCYFIRKGPLCDPIYQSAQEIVDNYSNMEFKYFKKPADEPVMALAMTLHGCKPTVQQGECFAYYPLVQSSLEKDYFARHCRFTWEGKEGPALLVHYGSVNTILPDYTVEAAKVHFFHKKRRAWNAPERLWHTGVCKLRYRLLLLRRQRYPQRAWSKLLRILKLRD